ncbi:MAG: GerMN domain-containing protein [Nitrospirae bacterium]|nr:GerMN domain-containing protein [Nitrospirota bacterium]
MLFAAGIAGGYFYFSKKFPQQPSPSGEAVQGITNITDDLFTIRVYYPVEGRLQMEERKVQRKPVSMAVAEEVVAEFLKGPANVKVSEIPKDTKIFGLYRGDDGILYVDLSDEFRRNFTGDAIEEFLLLKGFYESLISNVQDITDVKILIEGKEMENLAGHIYLIYPLKDVVSSDASDLQGTTVTAGGADKDGQ